MNTNEERLLAIKTAQRMANEYGKVYVVLLNGLIVDEESIKEVVDQKNIAERCIPQQDIGE